MHGGSGSDDEAEGGEGGETEWWVRVPSGREDEKRVDQGDLASVRGPTGRWNPRSRLIAIKAPLRLRL